MSMLHTTDPFSKNAFTNHHVSPFGDNNFSNSSSHTTKMGDTVYTQNYKTYPLKTAVSSVEPFPNQAAALIDQRFPEHAHHFAEFNRQMMDIHKLNPFSEEWKERMANLHTSILPDSQGKLASKHFDGQGNLNTTINMGDFLPEEIVIELRGDNLCISAEHHEDSRNNHLDNKFAHSIFLPPNIDRTTLNTNLTGGGRLLVEARAFPPQPALNTNTPIRIPINYSK
uniref:SHSP domain-containing protein n=1 Tax=Rhabditophanes sp. KR3021 TaxID=114890 RepID=A0AC35TXA3_9BILA